MISLQCQNGRCFFEPFNATNDKNKKTGRAGLAYYKHSGFWLFLGKLFRRVIKYQDGLGRVTYLNKGSLTKWFYRHGQKLRSFTIPEINKKAWEILLKEKQPELNFANIELSEQQIRALDYKNLTKQQFDDIFSPEKFKERLSYLSKDAIMLSLNSFDLFTFTNLSTEQIQKLDLLRFTKEQIDMLFNKSVLNIKRLTPKQLRRGLKYISDFSLKSLSEEQAIALVPLLNAKMIKSYHMQFSVRMFELLSVDQVRDLLPDLKTGALTKEQFLGVVTNNTRVKNLRDEQIHDALPYFDQKMLTWLSDAQLNAIEMDKVSDEVKKLVQDEKDNRTLK